MPGYSPAQPGGTDNSGFGGPFRGGATRGRGFRSDPGGGGGPGGQTVGDALDFAAISDMLSNIDFGGSVDQGQTFVQPPAPAKFDSVTGSDFTSMLQSSGLLGALPELGGFANPEEAKFFIESMARTSIAVNLLDFLTQTIQGEIDFLRQKQAAKAAQPEDEGGFLGLGGAAGGGLIGLMAGGPMAGLVGAGIGGIIGGSADQAF